MIWIIVIILIFIAIQLIRSNRLKERKLEMETEGKEENEVNDLLKHKYPHLFYEMKDELRSYYHNLVEYNKDFKRALEYHIDTRDDLIVSNTQILKKIQVLINESKNKKELEDKMIEMVKYSRNFFENLSKQRDITEEEKSFISFLVWDRIDENIPMPERILELDKDTIKWWHEDYESFFPIKKL